MTTPDDFTHFLSAPEGLRLEFKAATGGFHFDTLLKYIVALANEGGGKVILGVTDQRPRQVVGTTAFAEPGRTEAGIYERLHRRVPVEEQYYEGKRVVLVHVPSRPLGAAWSLDGTFWMRAGDNLEKMTDEQLRLIHLETGPDFSAAVCPQARLSDLDEGALDDFRQRWVQRTGNERLRHRSDEQILADDDAMDLRAHPGEDVCGSGCLRGERASTGDGHEISGGRIPA